MATSVKKIETVAARRERQKDRKPKSLSDVVASMHPNKQTNTRQHRYVCVLLACLYAFGLVHRA